MIDGLAIVMVFVYRVFDTLQMAGGVTRHSPLAGVFGEGCFFGRLAIRSTSTGGAPCYIVVVSVSRFGGIGSA